ncbi:MAG: methyltransferase [Bacteroidota bacterium]|jgi:SAM-dependent methyltransferase|nr:methyltransferase [Bacteroidota bacterium]
MKEPQSLETIVCPFCDSDRSRPYDSMDGFNIVKCKACGFVYTNPRPYIKDLGNYYSEEYYLDERHKKKYYNPDGSIINEENDSEAGITQIENYVNKRGKILEIGAARGGFLKELKKRGWETYGVEISESACKIAKEQNGIDLFCGSFKEYEPDFLFDAICMYQTLEHLPDPKFVLQKCFDKLKPGGLLIISVPNLRSFDLKLSKDRRRLSYDLPRHLNHFDDRFLNKHLSGLGFKVLEIDLYYPKFVFSLLNTLRKSANEKDIRSVTPVNNNTSGKYPELFKYNITAKGQLLKSVSEFFPGWKLTLIAKKP